MESFLTYLLTSSGGTPSNIKRKILYITEEYI